MIQGRVLAIYVSASAGVGIEPVTEALAVAGLGLEGDRYWLANRDRAPERRGRHHVSLIEEEALEAARRDYGVELVGIDTRRNLVTRGMALNHLVGREFRIGGVRLVGTQLCEPCETMERMCGKKGAREALVHRGGLRATILEGGWVRCGDGIEAE